MLNPYTLSILIESGNPDGTRLVEQMNWSGLAIAFPREEWKGVAKKPITAQPGVYILIGEPADEDALLPLLYIGESEDINKRLEQHAKKNDFWSWAIVLTSKTNSLNKAHVKWLEYELIQLAMLRAKSVLQNQNTPQKPSLTVGDEVSIKSFFDELLKIVPVLGLEVFKETKKIVSAHTPEQTELDPADSDTNEPDTIVVPAKPSGFDSVFLGENCWYQVRIAPGKLHQLKYIAAYVTAPVGAITHLGEIESIEPYGLSKKFKLNFKGPAQKIRPVRFDGTPGSQLQGSRYTTKAKLLSATTTSELFE